MNKNTTNCTHVIDFTIFISCFILFLILLLFHNFFFIFLFPYFCLQYLFYFFLSRTLSTYTPPCFSFLSFSENRLFLGDTLKPKTLRRCYISCTRWYHTDADKTICYKFSQSTRDAREYTPLTLVNILHVYCFKFVKYIIL